MGSLYFHIRLFVFSFLLLFLFWGCNCKTPTYPCPDFSEEAQNMLNVIENTNYIFESDSGRRLILKTIKSSPEAETSETCTGTRSNCDCNDCNASNYFEIHAIDTSDAAQFWHITFIQTYNLTSNTVEAKFNIETVTFDTEILFPFTSVGLVQDMGTVSHAGKIYKDVFRVEIKEKNSLDEFGYIMLNSTQGIIGFKELDSEEIFYRL